MVEKLATVHRSFAMDAETRTALMLGDGVVLAIVSETLAEPERYTASREDSSAATSRSSSSGAL